MVHPIIFVILHRTMILTWRTIIAIHVTTTSTYIHHCANDRSHHLVSTFDTVPAPRRALIQYQRPVRHDETVQVCQSIREFFTFVALASSPIVEGGGGRASTTVVSNQRLALAVARPESDADGGDG
jgi:hypothetical protein